MRGRYGYMLGPGWLLALPILVAAQTYPTISGRVLDATTGQSLPGVTILFVSSLTQPRLVGTRTDASGQFSLAHPLPARADSLRFSLVGYNPQTIAVPPAGISELRIILIPGQTLEEVTIRPGATESISNAAQMSQIALPVAQLARLPTLLGEPDLLRLLQLLPGVQKASEGNAGIYVRGGGPDQNLIRLDGATVYNPSHLLGFFFGLQRRRAPQR